MTTRPLVLSLCDYSGEWSRPYAEAGYRVERYDLERGQDVRLLRHPGERVRGILAAPPCTHFARVGAPHWHRKGDAELLEGLSVVDACLRLVTVCRPDWWALENPIGRLQDYLGPPQFRFQPHHFGDAWTKATWLWGQFTPPLPLFSETARRPVAVVLAGKPGSRDRTSLLSGRDRHARSQTPAGFAQAFYEANK